MTLDVPSHDNETARMSRRLVLRGLCVGTVLIAANGWIGVERAAAASTSDPWASWQALPDAATYPDPRIRAIGYAILAPNAQNLQPWLVRLVGDDALLVFADLSRRLPVSDPPDRQLTVSFGTFAELLRIGASASGYSLQITPFPQGEPGAALDARPIVAVRFVKDATANRDPLADHVLARSTNRLPFDTSRSVAAEQIAQIRAAAIQPDYVNGTVDPAVASQIRDIAHRAYVAEINQAEVRRELINITRIGRAEAASYAWGPALLGSAVEAKLSEGTISRAALDDTTSAPFKSGVENYLRAVDSGRAYVWVLTPDNSRRSMFEAGREWTRLHLTVTAMGLSLQPHSQSLHDYPEIKSLKAEMHAAVGAAAPARLQMLGRVGYAPAAPHSPRKSMTERLIA